MRVSKSGMRTVRKGKRNVSSGAGRLPGLQGAGPRPLVQIGRRGDLSPALFRRDPAPTRSGRDLEDPAQARRRGRAGSDVLGDPVAAGRMVPPPAGCGMVPRQALTDRLALYDALEFARSGDTLIVWKLDCLARSMKQLIETVETLQIRGIGFRSLTEALDTTTAQGWLVFHMFGALAECERSLIRDRTQAGLTAARRAGREAVRQNSPTTTSRLPRRCWPTPTSASHRRRSIGTSRPREPRIRRALDNGRSTPKTGRSRSVSV